MKEDITKFTGVMPDLWMVCRLCKLLTSPVTEIKDLVAHFLFILCKENGQLVWVMMGTVQ